MEVYTEDNTVSLGITLANISVRLNILNFKLIFNNNVTKPKSEQEN